MAILIVIFIDLSYTLVVAIIIVIRARVHLAIYGGDCQIYFFDAFKF